MADPDETMLSIPDDVAEKIKERAEEKGFKSLSEYVTYILRQVLSKIDAESNKKEVSSKDGEEEIKQKLRDMGYLD